MAEYDWGKRGFSLVEIQADFESFCDFKFRQNLGITAFFMFSHVNCVCEQRVDVSVGKVIRNGKTCKLQSTEYGQWTNSALELVGFDFWI